MALVPRVVLVTRKSIWRVLLEQHGTEGQARFVLSERAEDPELLVAAHAQVERAIREVQSAIPLSWRRARLDRSDLDRFLFEPEDVVVVVGQDGLVANVAKYLDGQLVIGVDGAPGVNAGVLVRHDAETGGQLLQVAGEGKASGVESRALVQATLSDGQVLRGLNEVFIGHRSHQSARYLLDDGRSQEHQSSSGVLVATGTGSTGWASSLHRGRAGAVALPSPAEARLAWFVREAWSSPRTGCGLTDGQLLEGESLRLTSELESGGVVFADGIEADHLRFDRGQTVTVCAASQRLNLMVA
jgi:hypothetical protein